MSPEDGADPRHPRIDGDLVHARVATPRVDVEVQDIVKARVGIHRHR
jgi:hypothetical protein